MQDSLSKAKSLLLKIKPWHLLSAAAALICVVLALWAASRIKNVTVSVDGEITEITTICPDPYKILSELEIEVEPGDKVTYTNLGVPGIFGELGKNEATVTVQSAVQMKIKADSLNYHVTVAQGDTVGTALEVSGLEVREHDILSTDINTPATQDAQVELTRVDYVITTEEETIFKEKSYRGTSLLKNGRTSFISYGKNGLLEKTYQEKLVNGVLEEKTLLSEEVVKKAVNDQYVIGDGSVISPLDYGYEIVNGVPTTYVKKYEKVRSTGYYAPYGSGTASGRRAQVGYVAVDPKVIPYGTKLWIVAHGNTGFVYGYALAADTGGAMLSGRNFVDLYYESYYECVLHGMRYVDVYVLG